MDAKTRAGVVRTLRKLFTLAGRVRLDIGDNGRVLPVLSPADLWRTLPGLMRDACDLADATGETFPGVDTKFARELATTIERGHKTRKVG